MLKFLVTNFRPDLQARSKDIAKKTVPANLKPIVVSNQGYPRSRIKKGQLQNFEFDWYAWHLFLCSIFIKNAKMTLELLLNTQIRQKLKIGKMPKSTVNSVKSGIFGPSKRQNSAVFQYSDLKYCTHIHEQVSL